MPNTEYGRMGKWQVAACTLGALCGITLSKMYTPLLAALIGLPVAIPAEIRPSEQRRLEYVDKCVQEQFFKHEARLVLRESSLHVALMGDTTMAGSYQDGKRFVEKSVFEQSSIERIVFHESVHHLYSRGLIDTAAFRTAYDAMKAEVYPLKNKVRERLAKHNALFTDWSEVVAHTAELLMYDTLEASPEVEGVLSRCVNFGPRNRKLVSRWKSNSSDYK